MEGVMVFGEGEGDELACCGVVDNLLLEESMLWLWLWDRVVVEDGPPTTTFGLTTPFVGDDLRSLCVLSSWMKFCSFSLFLKNILCVADCGFTRLMLPCSMCFGGILSRDIRGDHGLG